ncbi:hypothetical protein [Tenacibaculum finnmarkense]|uniref:hypothetical protein n=1 Tax=Tenacibaculum finnmarkense TaxID=2781243 RepID=UPI003BB527FC
MDLEQIYEGFENEIKRNLQQRMRNNNSNLNILDVKEESIFFLLVNSFLMLKRLESQYDINKNKLPEPERTLLFNGLKKVLYKLILNKDNLNKTYDDIIKGYETYQTKPNIKDLINNHYNNLYNDYSNNILK